MKNQKSFKLDEISTKEKADGETTAYKYICTELAIGKDVTITVKGEGAADLIGMPTDSIGDEINIEFGATNKQTKIKEKD